MCLLVTPHLAVLLSLAVNLSCSSRSRTLRHLDFRLTASLRTGEPSSRKLCSQTLQDLMVIQRLPSSILGREEFLHLVAVDIHSLDQIHLFRVFLCSRLTVLFFMFDR